MAATYDVHVLARRLMNEHGLGHVPFEFDRAKSRFGACWYRGGKATKISLSEPMCRVNTIERIREVILHEIAHALAGKAAGHGPVWRSAARNIGLVNPKTRCGHEDTVSPVSPYNAFCSACSNEKPIAVRQRAPKPVTYRCPTHKTAIVWLPAGKTLVSALDRAN